MQGRGSYPKNPTFRCIAAPHRRGVLLALLTWGPSLSEQRLASYLEATSRGAPSPDTQSIEAIQQGLTHIHLPMLEAAGHVTWDRSRGIVETTTHPALDDPRFARLLGIQTEALNEVFSALSHDYRRIGLTVLEDEQEPMSLAELARDIQRRVPETTRSHEFETPPLIDALHHAHLPKLDAMGFVEYAREEGQARWVGHPVLRDVFTIIHEPADSTTNKMEGFLDGLADSYRRANREMSDQLEWPHNWRHPHHG